MANEVDRVMRALNKVTKQLITKLTLDVTANLIATTPVDTGWARANWIPTIGTPALPLGSPTSRSEKLSIASAIDAQQQASLVSISASYSIDQGSVFITNNVPYIRELNNGTSAQAPRGFVQTAVEKAVRIDLRSIVR